MRACHGTAGVGRNSRKSSENLVQCGPRAEDACRHRRCSRAGVRRRSRVDAQPADRSGRERLRRAPRRPLRRAGARQGRARVLAAGDDPHARWAPAGDARRGRRELEHRSGRLVGARSNPGKPHRVADPALERADRRRRPKARATLRPRTGRRDRDRRNRRRPDLQRREGRNRGRHEDDAGRARTGTPHGRSPPDGAARASPSHPGARPRTSGL